MNDSVDNVALALCMQFTELQPMHSINTFSLMKDI